MPLLPVEDPPRRLRLAIDAALSAAFALVVLGGIVRVADAGLGCGPAGSGLHGWPLCRGGLVPSAQTHTVLEYSHRFLAAVLVVALVAVLWAALREARGRGLLVGGAVAALAVVVVQALLGALTVEYGLSAGLVAVHLAVAMLLLALLLTMALEVRGRPVAPAPAGATAERALRPLAALACLTLLTAITSGGLVAGTERHGTPGDAAAVGAHMACGPDFPGCNGALLPFGEAEMVDIQLAHRAAMLLAAIAVAALAVALYRAGRGGLALAIAMVLSTQLWLGAMNIWAGESALLVIAHLTVASVLWLLVAAAAALTNRAPEPERARPWGLR